MTDYIVLRDKSLGRLNPGELESLRPTGGPGPFSDRFGPSTHPMIEPEPEISVESLEPSDMRDLARDPTFRQKARPMPTKLIDTVGRSSANPQGQTTWGVHAVGADETDVDGSGVTVAVLDTGIDRNHVAFTGVNIIERDFTGTGNGDGNGHGTHCAGTIFGRNVNGLRIGVAPGVSTALIGKVLDDNGSGGSQMLFEALQWAAIQQSAHVISMSLGFDFPGLTKSLADQGWPVEIASSVALEAYRENLRMFDAIMDMIRAHTAFSGGSVVVAAAGNESRRQVHANFEVSVSVPAAAVGVVSVGAAGEGQNGLTIADFSNTNPLVCGPGVNVISAEANGGLVSFNGTSMATPHVAGVAALWWQKLQTLPIPVTSDTVRARILSSSVTDPFAPGVDIPDRGAGLVSAPHMH